MESQNSVKYIVLFNNTPAVCLALGWNKCIFPTIEAAQNYVSKWLDRALVTPINLNEIYNTCNGDTITIKTSIPKTFRRKRKWDEIN